MPFNDPSSNSMNTAVLCFLGTKFCFWRFIPLFLWDQPEISQDFKSTEASTSFIKIWRDKGKDIEALGFYMEFSILTEDKKSVDFWKKCSIECKYLIVFIHFIQVVVNALFGAIPSIFNVLLVCVVFWLLFNVLGVKWLGNRFWKCTLKKGSLDLINDKHDCISHNGTWTNSVVNFDNVGMGYLALLQVVSSTETFSFLFASRNELSSPTKAHHCASVYLTESGDFLASINVLCGLLNFS